MQRRLGESVRTLNIYMYACLAQSRTVARNWPCNSRELADPRSDRPVGWLPPVAVYPHSQQKPAQRCWPWVKPRDPVMVECQNPHI